jgi:hypothetical protein
MGGIPALGYDLVERKLVANPQKSAIIQEMFSRFAATPSRSLNWRGRTCFITNRLSF